jgi:23S rRNA (cytosine1962-C5)-methyltransferase
MMEGMSEPVGTGLPVVRLKVERQTSHPWIFQKMVEKPAERLRPGT